LRRGCSDPDFADDARWQTGTTRDVGPVLAAIGGLEDSALQSTRDQRPRPPISVPDGGVNNLRVCGIENRIEGARRIAAEQDLAPGFPAVGRLEYAALRIRPPHVAERRDVRNVGILRVNADSADLPCVSEAGELPRFAGVGGFENTVTVRHV